MHIPPQFSRHLRPAPECPECLGSGRAFGFETINPSEREHDLGICPACDGDGYAHEPAPRAWPPLSQAEMDRRLALVADLVEVQS